MSAEMALGGAGIGLQLFGGMYQKRAAKAAAAASAIALADFALTRERRARCRSPTRARPTKTFRRSEQTSQRR